jgi:hypothetical protein
MRIALLALLTSWFLFHASMASAEGNLALGLKGGSTGLGLEATYRVAPMLNLRAGGAGFLYSGNFEQDGNDFSVDARLASASLLADFHPFRGSFRISAGGLLNFNQLKGKATGDLDIDGTTYQNGVLNAEVDFNTLAPYVGLGWGNAFRGGRLTFMTDIGVIYAGSPSLSLDASVPGLDANQTAQLETNLAEEKANLQSELDNLPWLQFYPVVTLGLSYRF